MMCSKVLWMLTAGILTTVDSAAAHEIAVVPTQPTVADAIVLRVTGQWPGGSNNIAAPVVSRSSTLIRLGAVGVLPGIPVENETYENVAAIGPLPAGQYHVEYFIDTLAAPVASEDVAAAAAALVATLDFVVVSGTSVPALSDAALVLLAVVLAAAAMGILRRHGSLRDAGGTRPFTR